MTKKEKFMDWVEDHSTHIIVGATLVSMSIIAGVSVRNNFKYWKTANEAVKKITDSYTDIKNCDVGAINLGDMGEFGKKFCEATGCSVTSAVKKVDLLLDETAT